MVLMVKMIRQTEIAKEVGLLNLESKFSVQVCAEDIILEVIRTQTVIRLDKVKKMEERTFIRNEQMK